MSMVLKYLRASALAILVVILLLATKAVCDLTLPFYTSAIVNVGIQQGGIESPVPIAMRQSTMESLLSVLDEEDAALLLSAYSLDMTSYGQTAYVLTGDAAPLEPLFSKAFSAGTDQVPESIMRQMAFAKVRLEYEALGIDTGSLQMSYIATTGWKMIGISFLSALCAIMVAFLSARIAASLAKRLRHDLFEHVISFSQKEMNSFSTASLITRTTNDIQHIQMSLVMILRVVVFAPIMAIGALFRVVNTNSSMTWIIGVAVLAMLAVVTMMFLAIMPSFKRMQQLVDRVNQVVRETLSGLQVIRAFNTQEHEKKRFDRANRDLRNTALFINRSMSAMMPLMMLVMNLTTVFIVYKGASHIDAGNMQVGDILAFIQYTMQIIMSFLMISMLSIILPRASVSVQRVKEVLETPVSIKTPSQQKPFSFASRGKIEFRDVGFAYPGASAETLSDINCTIEAGSTTAIIGSTGSGKSTLLNLIPRFYDVTRGELLVDGVDVREADLSSLRKKIGYVPQQGILFSGTVSSNIAYGNEKLDEAEMRRVASIAQAHSFITEMPDAYNSLIAQGGHNVSGGQRQRLSIARALAIHPDILLFDDSFSALDYRTESIVRKRLHDELKGTTVLIVAQRISSILHADRILVLDEGRLVGSGTHKQLLASCSVYQQIAYSQLSPEEIARNE